MKRREALFSIGALMAAPVVAKPAQAEVMHGYPQDMALDESFLPKTIKRGGARQFLTNDQELKTLQAAFDRLIPGDEHGPSASEAGCLDFLDAQLSGVFGDGATVYRDGPAQPHEEQMLQKAQFIATPRERYRAGLQALEAYAQKNDNASFADLQPNRQDEILSGMENGSLDLGKNVNTKAFFELMLMNVREGYFADPLYGGNKDMAGWKMIGFPGARYDYRAYTDRTGQELNLVPVSLIPKD